MEKSLITPIEAAEMLSIGRTKLYTLLGTELPVVRIGRSARLHVDDVREYSQRCRREARKALEQTEVA